MQGPCQPLSPGETEGTGPPGHPAHLPEEERSQGQALSLVSKGVLSPQGVFLGSKGIHPPSSGCVCASRLGILIVRHLKRLERVILGYLEVSDGPEEKARLGILETLQCTIEHAWPRYLSGGITH